MFQAAKHEEQLNLQYLLSTMQNAKQSPDVGQVKVFFRSRRFPNFILSKNDGKVNQKFQPLYTNRNP